MSQSSPLLEASRARLDAEVARRREREAEQGVERASAQPVPGPEAVKEVQPRRRETQCGRCGLAFMASVLMLEGRELFAQKFCDPCCAALTAEQEAREQADIRRDREIEWEDLCPEDYRDADLARLQADWDRAGVQPQLRVATPEAPKGYTLHPISMAEILATRPGDGLSLVGATGRGKTRLMFALLRGYHLAGHRVLYVNGATFADKLAAQYGESAGAAERWMTRHIRVPVLFYDDLGKEAISSTTRRMSERAESALYRLVEERKAHRRTLFFTSNKTRAELLERMSEDRGAPIVRRLVELCRSVRL